MRAGACGSEAGGRYAAIWNRRGGALKLREKIERLRRAAPNASAYGQLYKEKSETSKGYKRVTLYTLFQSEEQTHLIKNHVFDAKEYRTPKMWAAWFSENLSSVHRNAVLPGIAVRTGKSWAVLKILGWVGHAEYSSKNSQVAGKRNKAKRKGRKNG